MDINYNLRTGAEEGVYCGTPFCEKSRTSGKGGTDKEGV